MTCSRKCWVGGNWKSNGSVQSISDLAQSFAGLSPCNACDIVIFPTALHYSHTRAELPKAFNVGLQNISATGPGAYTGEITADMATNAGCSWTLLGHSERRALYGESHELVAAKLERAQAASLKVALCIGETLEDREAGKTLDICIAQLTPCLSKIKNWDSIVIAYEPVWAIGTGKVATKEQAQETHVAIRNWLATAVSADVAASVRIVYGGSVTDASAADLIALPDVDGFLVGGASLKPAFMDIISHVCKHCGC